MSFYSSRTVKAVQKNHRCDWCGEHILKGESAIYHVGTHDGDFFSGHMHPECHPACGEYCRKNPYDDGYTLHEGVRGKPELKEDFQ